MVKSKRKRSEVESRSRKPKNAQGRMKDKQYRRNERSIRHVVLNGLAHRRLNIQARTVTRQAKITPPTFYKHCSDTTDALIKYERELLREFAKALPKSPRREVIWTIFLAFIERNHAYFCATAKSHNFFLLVQILNNLRAVLVGNGKISNKSYSVYTANVVAVVYCWIQHDKRNKAMMNAYVKKLLQIRFYEF